MDLGVRGSVGRCGRGVHVERGWSSAQGPGPSPIPDSRPGLAGAGLGRGPPGGGWGPRQRLSWLRSGPGRAQPSAPGRSRGRGLVPGAGRPGGGASPRGRGGRGKGGGGWSGPPCPEDSAARRAGGCGRAPSERVSGAGRAMGRQAAGALLLALVLHGRLLGVSVRGGEVGGAPGPARRPRQLGWGAEAARLGLWPGTAAPARDPGPVQAGATLLRGAVPKGTQGTPRWTGGGAGPRGSPWVARPRC